ncbi:hypothetical protein POM88_045128 [Heracleum sosnowskyi]|uniref:Uncharacterized protein n=1 Tax=Heracleum sosnowskyi TaxID=360622 RepID=A0AAD8H570_9APIA|nr:hypothetical protein POM88_045128 [Heracleum sosnowskyi]
MLPHNGTKNRLQLFQQSTPMSHHLKYIADNASRSSSDAAKYYFNIDYAPFLDLKQVVVAKRGKDIASPPPPISRHFVSMNDNSVLELSVKSVLELQIPASKDLPQLPSLTTVGDADAASYAASSAAS